MDSIVNQLAEQLASSSNSVMEQAVQLAVKKQLASLDVKGLIRETVEKIIKSDLSDLKFPDGSIPATALNFKDFSLNGSQVIGGIHEQFGSTGIDDQATDCKLTIMDDYVVIENQLFAHGVTVKSNLVVDGDFILKGDINTDNKGFQKLISFATDRAIESMMSDKTIGEISKAAADKLQTTGIDVDKLTIGGKLIVEDGALSKVIKKSSLQSVGLLDELQVKGEAHLSNTLYTSNKRTGINTLEPSASLAVWDEECEIVTKKYEKNTGFIGSVRSQRVIIGSNNNVNIVLDTDGSTKVTKLKLGNVSINCYDEMPNWEGAKGDIVFNEEPKVKSPMGWVCLGGSRWACLATITE